MYTEQTQPTTNLPPSNTTSSKVSWNLFRDCLCPCFYTNSQNQPYEDSSSVESKVDKDSILQSAHLDIRTGLLIRQKTKNRKLSESLKEGGENSRWQTTLSRQTTEFPQKTIRQSMIIELTYNNRMRSMEEVHFPICSLTQQFLMSIGSHCEHILVKVSSITLQTDPKKFKKHITLQSSKKQKSLKYNNYEFDRFWDHRYQFFDRFDEGIKIKEESWSILPSESLAEYIASKCKGAKIILDGFASVGSIAIKMANLNSCAKVIASQSDKEKLAFLLNNAKIYEVDNFIELSNEHFLQTQRKGIDVVFLQPPAVEFDRQKKMLQSLIGKAMGLAPNLIMLLPPETSIEVLSTAMYKWAHKLNWMRDFCSITIEKIYYRTTLKYILVCAGKIVQNEIKLIDELEYVYQKLKKKGDKVFKHKKIVKKIREDHGMLELLHLVKMSEKEKRIALTNNKTPQIQIQNIDFFYDLVVERQMVTQEKVNKIKLEQEESMGRSASLLYSGGYIAEDMSYKASPIMEEQKIEESPRRDPQITASQYSYLSYFESLGNRSREMTSSPIKSNACSSQGVVIKRTFGSSHQNIEGSLEERQREIESIVEEKEDTSTSNNHVSLTLRGSDVGKEIQKDEQVRRITTLEKE